LCVKGSILESQNITKAQESQNEVELLGQVLKRKRATKLRYIIKIWA
jgi:hypothetical protein